MRVILKAGRPTKLVRHVFIATFSEETKCVTDIEVRSEEVYLGGLSQPSIHEEVAEVNPVFCL